MAGEWRTTTVVKRWRTLQADAGRVWKLQRLEVDFDEGEVVETWQHWQLEGDGGGGNGDDGGGGEGKTLRRRHRGQ